MGRMHAMCCATPRRAILGPNTKLCCCLLVLLLQVTVVLKRLFTPDEAAEGGSAFVSEMEADVTAECKKLGTIEKVGWVGRWATAAQTEIIKRRETCVCAMQHSVWCGAYVQGTLGV